MQTAAEKFLTPAERDNITQAVRQAECLTSGEIVPMVVSSSYHYPMAEVTGGVFSEKLYKTKAENGILLFISVFERKVWILADAGINAKIGQDRWQGLIELITGGIRDGQQSEALCEAIRQVGDILKEHFPIKSDDINELRNLIIR